MAERPRFSDDQVGAALDLLSSDTVPDVDWALARQRSRRTRRVSNQSQPRSSLMSRMLGQFAFLRRPMPAVPIAAVLLFALSMLTSPMQSLASQFLTIFRVQDFQPITISTNAQGMYGVPDLTMFGDMSPSAHPDFHPEVVADLATASAAVGFPLKTPAQLPAGLASQPSRIAVTPAQTVTFTFRSAKARAYLDSIDQQSFSLPEKFDGASIQVTVPATAMMTFARTGTALPNSMPQGEAAQRQAMEAMMDSVTMVEARAPSVQADGVSFQELRDFLLSLPGLPAETAAQIRAIGDLSSTLPVPVPTGASARKIQVNGSPGLIMAEQRNRLAGGILWQNGGIIYAVGGALNESDLMNIAASVR
jgi:hypothetical protein